MRLIQFLVAVPFALICGLRDGLGILVMTVTDVPALCFKESCWPWECYGGVYLEQQDDDE